MSNRTDAPKLSADSADRLDRLFRLYSRPVLILSARWAKRPADAEDIAAETWLKVSRSVSQLRADDERAMAWLASAVRTVAIDFYRPKRQSEEIRDWTDAVESRPLPVVPAAEDSSDLIALADLSAVQSTALRLAAQGLSHRAIAARMGRSRGAVYTHLNRGARRLRSSLGEAA
ncbi:RNA polymerase sigma factor [Streptomyces rubiginosohelvolus]|uniref:RNA polymerase sigma factor n=1 Tax=Streptomyces rubiginosohelvolus TaxID=67362 RepID=UPI0035D56288